MLLTNYCKEIDDPTNTGEGKKAAAIFEDIQLLIGNVQHPNLRNKGFAALKQHKNLVRQNVEAILKIKLNDYDNKIFNYVNPANSKKIKGLISYLDNKNTNKFKLNGNNKSLFDAIKESQVLIKLYSDKLTNKELSNNNTLTVESDKTKIEKLEDVFEVWKNYFKGNYSGSGFAFWCLGAALIDIAGFILFHMAFKKDEY